jgi:hypothetical protein
MKFGEVLPQMVAARCFVNLPSAHIPQATLAAAF